MCSSDLYAAAIPRFITALLNNKPPTIYEDGEQTRDFTYVRSVVEANIQALEARGAEGEVFNIACGESITVNELVKKMAEILNSNIQPIYTDSRPGDIRDSLADISTARRILGYEPTESLETGLAETVNFFRRIAMC